MKHIAYLLTMPNVGSWNGQFTGSGNIYCIVKSYRKDSHIPGKVLSMKSFHYDFGDGWVANVECREITAQEKTKYKIESKGFMSYGWMVEEIEEFGRIKTVRERDQEAALKKENIVKVV